jgi:ribosomal protein L29
MQNQKVKAYQLREKDETALLADLNRFRQELVGLRTSKVSSAPQVKLARIRVSTLTNKSLMEGLCCNHDPNHLYPL